MFGEVSVLGLKYFQRKNDLPETGVADRGTQELLFSNRAVECEEYVFPYKLVVDISEQKVYVGQWNGYSTRADPHLHLRHRQKGHPHPPGHLPGRRQERRGSGTPSRTSTATPSGPTRSWAAYCSTPTP